MRKGQGSVYDKWNISVVMAIVLSVLLQYTDSDYPFGIFKLFIICLIFVTQNYFIFISQVFYLLHIMFYNIIFKELHVISEISYGITKYSRYSGMISHGFAKG
jgi:hypothetical protein